MDVVWQYIPTVYGPAILMLFVRTHQADLAILLINVIFTFPITKLPS